MARKVHRVGTMVACIFHGRALLLTSSDFSKLVDRLLANSAPIDTAAFKIAVLQNTAIAKAREKIHSWESTFLKELEKEISTNQFDPGYAFEGLEAQRHIDDYLEAFRSSFKYINVATADTHDGADLLFNVTLRAKRSPIELLLMRYGKVIGEWNFRRSEVSAINGTSLNFILKIGALNYVFSPNGVRRGLSENAV
jgi:hypothetical protein